MREKCSEGGRNTEKKEGKTKVRYTATPARLCVGELLLYLMSLEHLGKSSGAEDLINAEKVNNGDQRIDGSTDQKSGV